MLKLALDKAITNPTHDYAETLAKHLVKWELEKTSNQLLVCLFKVYNNLNTGTEGTDLKDNSSIPNFLLTFQQNINKQVKLSSKTRETVFSTFRLFKIISEPGVKLDKLPLWMLIAFYQCINKLLHDNQCIHNLAYSSGIVDIFEHLIEKDEGGSYKLNFGFCDFGLTCDSDRWLTVHPHGKEHEGQAIKVSEKDIIKAGLGGKYNGKHLSELAPKSNNQAKAASNTGTSQAASASQNKAKPVAQAAAKPAQAKQGSSKSAQAAAKTANAKPGSTKSVQAAVKPVQAKQASTKSAQTKQGATKSVQAAAKTANTKPGSTKSVQAAAKTANTKPGSTKSVQAAAKTAQANQGSTKSVHAAAEAANTKQVSAKSAQAKQGATKSIQAAEKPVKANLKPCKLNVALYGMQSGAAATAMNEPLDFVNNALQRDRELCALALRNEPWTSVHGVKFDDEKVNNRFLALEQRYYYLRALQYSDAQKGTNSFAKYEQEAKAVTAKYNALCRKWAESEEPKLTNSLYSLNNEIRTLFELLPKSQYKATACDVCSVSKAPYMCYVGQVVKGAIKSWGQKVNDLAAKLRHISGTDDIKVLSSMDNIQSYVGAYALAHDCVNHLDSLRSEAGLNKEEYIVIERIYDRALLLEKKAKDVLLASTNTLSVEDALYLEVCKELKRKDPSNFAVIDAPKSLVTVHKGKEMSFKEADGNAPNPHYNENLKVRLVGYPKPIAPYRNNCQLSVITFEMRSRGFDVEARPFLEPNDNRKVSSINDEKLTSTSLIAWRNKETGLLPIPQSHADIRSVASAVKKGERHMLLYRAVNANGHIVTLTCDDSGVFIYDPQSGERFTVDKFAKEHPHVEAITTFRVDDCELAPHLAPKVLIKSKVGIPPTLWKFAVKDSLTEDSFMEEGSIDWFKLKIEQQTDCFADYAGELDGCMIFHLYIIKDENALTGPPMYAICDPNNLEEVDIKQGMEIYNRLYEKYPKSKGGKLID